MSTIDERIEAKTAEVRGYQQQIEQSEKMIAMQQNHREQLILALHRVSGALDVLNEIKAESNEQKEPGA